MAAVRAARASRVQLENTIKEVFPSLPNASVTSYIFHHPNQKLVDYLMHFLEIAEPSGKTISPSTGLALAQARMMIKSREKKEAEEKKAEISMQKSSIINPQNNPEIVNLRLLIQDFEPKSDWYQFSTRVDTNITRLRREKKRQRFLSDDFLTKIVFSYANELMMGYENLDSEKYNDFLLTHPEKLYDITVFCGCIPENANPAFSISTMLSREPDAKKYILSSSRYSGIGIAISKMGTIFFCLVAANID